MRLGTCIALELTCGVSIALGLGFGATWAQAELRSRWSQERSAALTPPSPAADHQIAPIEPSPVPEIVGEPASLFVGVDDDLLVKPLRHAALKHARMNRGGSSISLRVDLANGARAAFKPRQLNSQTVPRKEVAAYRINRLLDLNSVPPAIGRKFRVDDLYAALVPSSRFYLPRLRREVVVQRGGWVIGELSWWIPVIAKATVDGFRIDTTNGIVTWKRYLTVGKTIPESAATIVSQISSMVLFDFLIDNPDRWSGGNARTSEDGATLYFMDNTMSFGGNHEGHLKARIYLRRSQKFSASLVRRLRTLTAAQVKAVVSHDVEPFAQLLSDLEVSALMSRRDKALAYIDRLIRRFGEERVLVFK